MSAVSVRYRVTGGPLLGVIIAVVFLVIALIGSAAGNTIFIVVATATTCCTWYWALVGMSYEGTLSEDGAIAFRSVLRRQHTTARSVRRVSVGRGENTSWFKITFERGTARIAFNESGRQLVDEILTLNPTIEVRGSSARD